MLDLFALRQSEIANDPFAHVVVPDFVPDADLRQIVAGLPQLQSGGSFPIESLRLGDAARQMMRELEGSAFREAVAEKFKLNLEDAPTMITLRGWCREKDGRIHRDSAAKRVTVLLYLNPEADSWKRQEGCLRLLRGPDDIEDYVREVPPVNATLLVFPNGPGTWHGHKQYVGPRYVVQLNYMTGDAKARQEMRRHRLSAFVKRLLPAA
jgi:SM-20-related protein